MIFFSVHQEPGEQKQLSVICAYLNRNSFQSSVPICKAKQGCALAEPSGPWRLTFAPGHLENLSFLIEIILPGILDFTGSEHWAPFNFS